jgi:3-methylcrotonyl-CoA carboxylase alpha subunit
MNMLNSGMFQKVLIANRGEIAVRVIKTATQMGIRTVAVYSDADRNSLHVQLADEAVYIGEAPPAKSYLMMDKIIAAARTTGAQAIHPGYGFLSENAAFCLSCEAAGITFIGPPPAAIRAMGSKSAAKSLMAKANVPLVPGYHGDDQSLSTLQTAADEIGYPVLLKATAGGGGKGMRRVNIPDEFVSALDMAKRESQSSFGDDQMLVEKFVLQPRHVEVQVFCDSHGNAVYLFERDCSVQRRHQKIIEEAPAPNISADLRQNLGEAAISAALAIDYVGAGTVEFLLDANHDFYFMEMNTRLQVEHPVTEMITGEDLVAWQFKIACGEPLPLRQEQLNIHGHAFEARIYAEDPENDYLPAAGKLTYLREPETTEHIRVDTGVVLGDEVGVHYDPMIAKLIVWGENRHEALSRLDRALGEYHIGGVTTNVPFLRRLVRSEPFQAAEVETGFLDTHAEALKSKIDLPYYLALAFVFRVLSLKASSKATSPFGFSDSFRVNSTPMLKRSFSVAENQTVEVKGTQFRDSVFLINVLNQSFEVSAVFENQTLSAEISGHKIQATVFPHETGYFLITPDVSFFFIEVVKNFDQQAEAEASFTAPMNGTIVEVLKQAGDEVDKGEPIVIMEAMKMEHVIRAHQKGIVTEVFYAAGDLVDGGAPLIEFEGAA